MKPNFRQLAREHVHRAKELLATQLDLDLLLAALQLRMAMEALTYERAIAYSDELGPAAMKTWQPKKLMDRMLEVDPQADSAATISIGEEPSPGEKPVSMQVLGTDNVLNLRTLRKHYDALGSYLHTPTLAQLEQGKSHDMNKLRFRCGQIVSAIEIVLASKLWNAVFAQYGEYECSQCSEKIRRRLPNGQNSRKIECWNCRATYTMTDRGGSRVGFEPRKIEVSCPSKDCTAKFFLWEKDVERGTNWTCDVCGSKLVLSLCVAKLPKDGGTPASESEPAEGRK